MSDTGLSGIRLLRTYDQVRAYVNDAQKAADSQKKSLGFIQRSVFEEFAQRDELWVYVCDRGDVPAYCGHLMFQRRFPRAQVLQICIGKSEQGKGLASNFIELLKEQLTSEDFLFIYARVATDLVAARSFWEAKGFFTQSIQQGGKTTGRSILRLVFELSAPQLFLPSGLSRGNTLGFAPPSGPPLFLVDLNVLFDLSQPRRLRHEHAVKLEEARQMGYCRIAITDEIARELKRTQINGKTDPMASTLSIWPTFPLPSGNKHAVLQDDLLRLVFPASFDGNSLRPNDRSDIRHLVTTLAYEAAGFITSDKAILACSKTLKSKYGLEVVSPEELMLSDGYGAGDSQFVTGTDQELSLEAVNAGQVEQVISMLRHCEVNSSALAGEWAITLTARDDTAVNRYAVWSQKRCLGYVSWPNWAALGQRNAYAAVNDADPLARETARILLKCLTEAMSVSGPSEMRLKIPNHQTSFREMAFSYGFRAAAEEGCLQKAVLGSFVTERTWDGVAGKLADVTKIKLPSKAPKFGGMEQQILLHTPSGNRSYCTLSDLEILLSPSLFVLPGRPAVLTPIRPIFANALLNHSRQQSLLPQGSAQLFNERIYVCGHRIFRRLSAGMLVLFYESGTKSGNVVAIARLRETYLNACDSSMLSKLDQSALTSRELEKIGKSAMRTVMVLDNIFPFERPVARSSLISLGLGRPNDLMTTRSITEEQLNGILGEALGHG